jgi:hypothetical protein
MVGVWFWLGAGSDSAGGAYVVFHRQRSGNISMMFFIFSSDIPLLAVSNYYFVHVFFIFFGKGYRVYYITTWHKIRRLLNEIGHGSRLICQVSIPDFPHVLIFFQLPNFASNIV